VYSGVATLTYPANGASGVSRTPTLTWTPPAGSNYYLVKVWTPTWTSSDLYTSLPYLPVSLDPGVTWSWHVKSRSSDGGSWGPWSGTRTFTTSTYSGVATGPNPANGATGVSTSTTLTWTAPAGSNYYLVRIWTPTWTSAELYTSTPSLAVSLSPGVTWSWHVMSRSTDGSSWGPWGATWTFTTANQEQGRRFAFLVYCDPSANPIEWFRALVDSVYNELIDQGYAPANVHYLGFDGPQTNPNPMLPRLRRT
jgi:hypothetical protein